MEIMAKFELSVFEKIKNLHLIPQCKLGLYKLISSICYRVLGSKCIILRHLYQSKLNQLHLLIWLQCFILTTHTLTTAIRLNFLRMFSIKNGILVLLKDIFLKNKYWVQKLYNIMTLHWRTNCVGIHYVISWTLLKYILYCKVVGNIHLYVNCTKMNENFNLCVMYTLIL